jgi:hypothetical protein
VTTAQVIINRAFRESQIVPSDVAPSTSQIAEALPLLQGLVDRYIRAPIVTLWLGDLSAIKQQRGAVFRDFTPFVQSLAIPQDIYLNCVLNADQTILLPPSPGDGARMVILDVGGTFGTYQLTIVGNGNQIDGGASYVLNASGVGISLLYRRELANWVIITDIGLSNNIPYPTMYDDLFVIELAMRLDPRYGKEMSGITAEIYKQVRSQFVGRYMMTNSSTSPDILFDGWSGFNAMQIGNLGGVW